MTAAAAATESPFHVILSGEDNNVVFEIKVSGREFSRGPLRSMLQLEVGHAVMTDADLVPMNLGNLGDELRRNDNIEAPATLLVGTIGTELAPVWTTAKRALRELEYFSHTAGA